MRTLYAYIIASKSRVLSVGMTNNPYLRIAQHRAGLCRFTARYQVYRLVHIEPTNGPRAAIAREKQLKGWTRAKKIALVEADNPRWIDLARGWPSLDEITGSRQTGDDRRGPSRSFE